MVREMTVEILEVVMMVVAIDRGGGIFLCASSNASILKYDYDTLCNEGRRSRGYLERPVLA